MHRNPYFALLWFCGLFSLVSARAWAQDTIIVDDRNSRAFHSLSAGIPRVFQSDAEAQSVVDNITKYEPIWFPIQAYVTDDLFDIPNAEARLAEGEKRIIGFNRTFMQQVAAQSGNRWSLLGIAAHEIGHHVGRHIFDTNFENCPRNNEYELEADYHAGFALAHMGAKLDDAASALRDLPAAGDCTHPSRAERILVLGQGWEKANSGQTSNAASVQASTVPSTALSKFKFRKNRDVLGHDIEKIAGLSESACADRCLKNSKCRGYSFDRWHGWCFTKDAMPGSVLDPTSTIAVKLDETLPNVATNPPVIHKLRQKKFTDPEFSKAVTPTFDACLARCETTAKCVAFTFAKVLSTRSLFVETEGYFYDEGFDSGYKRQDSIPVAANSAARMEKTGSKFFKGDGYSKHEDISYKSCETFCIKDKRCQAIEHIETEQVCRLYAKIEPAFLDAGTTVAYKRAN